ncbi:hypothetical protein ABTZ99_37500 [Actinosynnema sp. NPDC002837]
MITMTPVVERPVGDCPFWSVEPGEYHVEVPRSPTPSRVAVLAWALVAHGVDDVDLHADVSDAVGAVDAFLAAEDERHVPGGLRIVAGDVVADPGCCFGLDEWRTWLEVLDGEAIWLGHSPDTVVQHRGEVVRIWPNEDLANPRFTGPHVDIARDALLGHLREVREDLVGFLDALGTWARSTVPDRADRFVAAVDRRLGISPPL